MFNVVEKKFKVGRFEVILETGYLARQAGGSVLLSCEGTQILVAVTANKEPTEGLSFFPLSVDYIEKFYAAGRIPGGYLKRESRPSDREVLIGRLTDRAIRPLFSESYVCETQVVATLVSYDPSCPPDALAIVAASAALCLSNIPFSTPVGSVKIGLVKDEFIVNPTEKEMESSLLELTVAGTQDAILMVEAGALFIPEGKMLEALTLAHEEIKKICRVQKEFMAEVGKEKRQVIEKEVDADLSSQIQKKFHKKIQAALSIAEKADRSLALSQVKKEILELNTEAEKTKERALLKLFEDSQYDIMRKNILDNDLRIDGRSSVDIRNINCRTGVLKRVHGSAVFTRGETQSLGVTTLGTSDDKQKHESVPRIVEEKSFMLHYNMPGYSVGEVKRLGSPGRREVGHGALAERALRASLPPQEKFPYTIRMVSEITESNGSSSMASVCSGTLSLLDAGVPLKEPIAGIAMGLIFENANRYSVLSDILGDEDNLGDMDFKVAGGREGITALQMDIKITGVSLEILKRALEQARIGRLHILEKMLAVIHKPNHLSAFAPRIEKMKIRAEKIRDLIGTGGKNIKKVVSDSGCKIEVNDAGIVSIASTDGAQAQKAKRMIQYLTTDPEINQVYLGIVKKVADFGAFVEIKPDVEGFIHISQLAAHKVNKTEDILKENDEVLVRVIELDRTGRIKLSRKDAIGATPVESMRDWTS